MDPIDFTKPEAFSQAGASNARGQHGAAAPVAPNPQGAQRLQRALTSLLLWTLLAPTAWMLLALLMAVLQQEQESESGFSWTQLMQDMMQPTFQTPMRELAWMSADTLFWPVIAVVVFVLLKGVLGQRSIFTRRGRTSKTAARSESQGIVEAARQARAAAKARAEGVTQPNVLVEATPQATPILVPAIEALRIIPLAVAGCATLWAMLAGLAFINGKDHWEALPWVAPPYLSEFQARHSGLTVERTPDTDGAITLRDAKGHWARLESGELRGARVRLESCPAQLSAEQLGGITPYPGMPCAARVHLSSDYGEQTLYVFDARGANKQTNEAIHAHFDPWAKAHDGNGGYDVERGRQWLSVGSGEWRLEVLSRDERGSSVVIRHKAQATR